MSNFDRGDLEDLWKIARGGAACNQVLYHLRERAIEHDVLPWCEQHGASTPEHVADNAGAGTLQLSEAELARIDAAFPLGPRPRTLPVL